MVLVYYTSPTLNRFGDFFFTCDRHLARRQVIGASVLAAEKLGHYTDSEYIEVAVPTGILACDECLKAKRTVNCIRLDMSTHTQTIWIARHGNRIDFVNPEWFNTAERRYDPPLSDDGVVQAYQLGQRLKGEGITHIFASPFLRTVQTANQVAEALDLPIKLESGLSEWLNSAWMTAMPERLSIEALTELFPRIDTNYNSRVVAEYPETGVQSLKRSGETARLLADEFPEDILLVGHGASVLGATMGLVGEIAKTEVKASLCCLVKVVRQDPEWVLELNGDTSHLSEIEEVIRFN